MSGITILSVGEGYVKGWGITPTLIFFLILGLLFIILAIHEGVEGELLLATGVLLIIISIIASGQAKIIDTYPIYKVTIDETVSLQEFNEKYEIISQEGLIYEIKEKGVDTN